MLIHLDLNRKRRVICVARHKLAVGGQNAPSCIAKLEAITRLEDHDPRSYRSKAHEERAGGALGILGSEMKLSGDVDSLNANKAGNVKKS